jgi:hypothetical protein
MASLPLSNDLETSRKKQSFLDQWSDAMKSRNIHRMAMVLRYAARFAYSLGNRDFAIVLIDQALQILPMNSPVRTITFQEFRSYTEIPHLIAIDFPVTLKNVNKVISLI